MSQRNIVVACLVSKHGVGGGGVQGYDRDWEDESNTSHEMFTYAMTCQVNQHSGGGMEGEG